MPRADWDFIGNLPVPIPDWPTQRAIADYLDRETARIDAMIAAKERLLALLAEKRRALITRAVTRGLDPNAPLRDSGIPWLGEIPEHWTRCHLKRALASLDYGISASVDTVGEVAVLRMGDIGEGEIDYSRVGFVNHVDDSLLLQPGDLVFNRTNSLDQIGKVALFRGKAEYPVSFASYLVRFRCGPAVLPEFLNWLLNSAFPQAWGRAEALPAIGQANLNPNRYGYLPIALPPLKEQEGIVSYIANWTARMDGMRAATERTIALLKERRSALIAAAVTGQIDVGSAA
jgi:type I restriction enzyme S subunit